MPLFAGLVILAAVQTPGEVEAAVRRLRAEGIEERQAGAQRLASIVPALLDALFQLDPVRRKADASTALRLGRIHRALREGLGPLLPPGSPLPPGFGTTDEDRDILEQLRSTRMGMERTEAPMGLLLDQLRERTGLNIHLRVAEGDRRPVVFQAAPTSAEHLLVQLLTPQGWTFDVRDGVIQITTIEEAGRQHRLVLYDVRDMTYSLDGPGVDIVLAGALDPVVEEPKETYTGEDLANRVKAATPSEVWEEADGLSIQFQNGLLIVRNTCAVQAQVARFLQRLRVLRERKRHGPDGFYADLDRAERRVKELIDALSQARRALDREHDAEDLELRLQAGQLLRGMEAELALPGLRHLLEPP